MGCDSSTAITLAASTSLSVSSNGSNGLRPLSRPNTTAPAPAFSILERIEWAATMAEVQVSPALDAFSILERIEWAATSPSRSRPSALSTFSILERIEWAATALHDGQYIADDDFQYPRTDRMGCDIVQIEVPVGQSPPFSILERIEWAATGCEVGERLTWTNFQYPRTDRMGCDAHGAPCAERGWRSFSILERIEWAATAPRSLSAAPCQCLSVSSNGSNGLRPTNEPTPPGRSSPFQYPRTDRMGCDIPGAVSSHTSSRLSVSSNGSNGLRPVNTQLTNCRTFYFQYPRTDRMGCDVVVAVALNRAPPSFSILERIEWAATYLTHRPRSHLWPFSILERIEWAATDGTEGL